MNASSRETTRAQYPPLASPAMLAASAAAAAAGKPRRNCASVGGLLPEQVWDAAPIPARGLAPGRPSGSAMPLLWSHAEFLKLLIAREAGQPVELLQSVQQRYGGHSPRAAVAWHWRHEVPIAQLVAGRALRIEDRQPFSVRYGFDGWQEIQERDAVRMPFGVWSVQLTAQELASHSQLDFTRRYEAQWEGVDHVVTLGHAGVQHALASVG